jgi:hypothetical protein
MNNKTILPIIVVAQFYCTLFGLQVMCDERFSNQFCLTESAIGH